MDYLVVANQTLAAETVGEVMRSDARRTHATFHLLVPATPAGSQDTPGTGGTTEIAARRLAEALERFRVEGLKVTGEVADADPMRAVQTAFGAKTYDGVIIATLPRGRSRWIHLDLPHRVARRWHVPVEWLTTQDDSDEPATVALIRPIMIDSRLKV